MGVRDKSAYRMVTTWFPVELADRASHTAWRLGTDRSALLRAAVIQFCDTVDAHLEAETES